MISLVDVFSIYNIKGKESNALYIMTKPMNYFDNENNA